MGVETDKLLLLRYSQVVAFLQEMEKFFRHTGIFAQ